MRWCWLLLALAVPAFAAAQGPATRVRVAEILEASGDVEISRDQGAVWTPIRTGQELTATDELRTRTSAFARIKFEAGIQWVLRAASRLQLRAAVTGAANTIRVRLESGKAVASWTPDRRPPAGPAGQADAAIPRAVVETPSGQAVILGTEWSLSVDADGRTALAVLEGSVELSNAHGSVTVGVNESAEMRVGQPPRLAIINPRDRVQWVADYSAQPLRFAAGATGAARTEIELSAADAEAGRTAAAITRLERVVTEGTPPAGALLALTDLLIAAGDLERAAAHADAGRAQYPADARFDALLSRIALFEDRPADSRALAEEATTKDPGTVDGWLALGEWARSRGDAPVARGAFAKATTVSPDDPRGWFGIGSVDTEKEAFVPARRWLDRALTLDPKGSGYRGELGTLETLANNFDAAEQAYTQALADRPGDYVAMTGRALLALKQGREAEALDLLLRATLIEPKYARAQIYLGVTYYRQRRHDDAIRALRKASQLDPKDPLPYLMESEIYTDVYEPAKAMVAGRTAETLMPNLKSLNQLANTQKGTANLGNSLAFMGLEQWSQHLAQESYNPFWAGSHLFLGDRYANDFARTSEYYQGLLADATVFGGSPLFQTLLPRTANYFTGDVSVGEDASQIRSAGADLSANGYINRTMPIGYAVSAGGSHGNRAGPEDSSHRPVTGSAAIGVAPTSRLSFYATGAVTREEEHFLFNREGSLSADWIKQGGQFDTGLNFRPTPTSSLAVRIGQTSTEADLPIGEVIPTFSFRTRPAEVQARYTTLLADRHELSAGMELASERQEVKFGIFDIEPFSIRRQMQSAQLYVSARSRWGRALFQADIFGVRERVDFPGEDESFPRHSGAEVQMRLGTSIQLGRAVLRGMFQERTRPWAAASTLGPVATAGIPINDDLVERGGDQQRLRTQLEWEWSSRTFVSAFAEHQRVDNRIEFNVLEDTVKGLQTGTGQESEGATEELAGALAELRDLARDASRLNVTALSLVEGEAHAASGTAATAGVALNRVLSAQVSLTTQYSFTDSSGVSAIDNEIDRRTEGQNLSYLPAHVLAIGTTWVSPRRLYLSGEAIYRSSRFTSHRFDAVAGIYARQVSPADWTARVAGSWESRDKRWAIEFTAMDLLAKSVHASYQVTAKVRR